MLKKKKRNDIRDFHAATLKEKSVYSSFLYLASWKSDIWQAILEHAFKNNSLGMMEEQEIKILGPHLYGAIPSTNLFLGNLMKVKLISIFLATSNVICILLTHRINLRKKASRYMRWEESREQRSRLKGLQLEKHVLGTGMIQCAGWISSTQSPEQHSTHIC